MIKLIKKLNIRLMGKIIYWLVFSVIFVTALIVICSSFNIPPGTKVFTVMSGSMSPAIRTGSIVITQTRKEYQKGDVITFKSEAERKIENPQHTNTHRIIKVQKTKDGLKYETKGDANQTSDSNLVANDLILGKVVFNIPLLGFTVSFAKTREGVIILIVIPATIIVYTEIINIKNEILKLMKKKNKKGFTAREKIEEKIGEEAVALEDEIKKDIKKI